jgi:molecular chaperone DnaJ
VHRFVFKSVGVLKVKKRDYYEILGVSITASQQEIKKRYHRLALKLHPDRKPNDKSSEDAFKEITEAYGILSNPQKRSRYDKRADSSSRQSPPGRGNRGQDFYWATPSDELLKDIFRDILGFPISSNKKRAKGEDLRYQLSIPFETAVLGKEVEIEVPFFQQCPTCRGSKRKPGTGFQQCPRCKGKGTTKRKKANRLYKAVCTKCKGEGKVVKQPCMECDGKGKIKHTRDIAFSIPPGVKTGTRLRIIDRGNPGSNGGPSGDLYVVIDINAHPCLEREGKDVVYHLPISFPQASLGDRIEIPTVEGPIMMDIPPGTQSGEVLRIKRKGIPCSEGNGRGDQQVIVEVKIPSKLTAKQKRLLKEFAQIS